MDFVVALGAVTFFEPSLFPEFMTLGSLFSVSFVVVVSATVVMVFFVTSVFAVVTGMAFFVVVTFFTFVVMVVSFVPKKNI